MNDGQQKFYHFILDRVSEEDKDKAEELLTESFGKQAEGTFNKEYLQEFIPKMMQLIKPEYQDEIKQIMANYRHE